MPAEQRRPRKKTNGEGRIRLRNQRVIIDAAIKVFARRGYDGTRIAEIAKVSGLPKPNIYYYFKSKDAIYKTIIKDLIAAWDKALGELDANRDPAEAITAYIRAKLDYSRKHKDESKIFANENVRGGSHISPADIRHIQERTRARERVFQDWIASGRMDPIATPHLFILLWASTQFYADFDTMARTSLEAKTLGAAEFAEAAETITRIVLKGCGIVSPPAPRVARRRKGS